MSAPRKRILESESYMTAVCDFNSSKQKPMTLCESSGASMVAESSTSEHESVAGYVVKDKPLQASDSSKEILELKKTVDQVRLKSLTGQEKQVNPKKDMVEHFHQASSEDSARKLQAMNKKLDAEVNKDGKVQLAELATMVRALKKEMEIVEAVEVDVSRESLWDMVKEGSSLRSLLESLELKLETFLSQKPELKDNKASTIKMLKTGCEFEASLEGGIPWEGMAEENSNADLLRTKSCRAALHAAEKLTLAVEEAYKDEAFQSRKLNKMETLSGGTDDVCVSNSESCAKILTSGEKFESSREKEEGLNKLGGAEVAAAMSQADADLTESSFTDFSIRNFVSTARNKDMKINWPFSRRSLKICLKSGVKNVLPPFQSFDSVRSNLDKHCMSETVSPAERSRLDKNPCWLKNNPVPGGSFYGGFDQKSALHCTDSNSTPSGPPANQDFILETTAHSQSEMESVSTSKIPLSEASDKQGATGSAVRQKTKTTPIFVPNKKRKLVVKLGANMNRGTTEDIASTRSLPPEAVAPKTCPVCGSFSSSSNTTLNAHIDQCLSVDPTSECMKGSQTVKPRIKPRKIRLMSDICATAPCCTLEELDIRNGRIPVADAGLAAHTNKFTEDRSQRESLRCVKDNGDDSAVYVDANGTKIRILSKTNDTSPIPKGEKDLKTKKSLKKKGSKFFSSSKKHLAKCLNLRKANVTKACVDGKAKHKDEELFPSSKIHEQNKVIESGKSMQALCSGGALLSENNCTKRKRGRPKSKVQGTKDLPAVSCKTSNSNIYKDAEKPGIHSVPNNIERNKSFKAVIDEEDLFTRENCFVPENSEAAQIHTSPVNEVEIDSTEILLKDSNDTSTVSGVERSHLCSMDEAPVALSTEIGQQCNSMEAEAVDHQYDKNELLSTTSSTAKLPPEELVTSFSRSSDPELLQFSGNLFGAASAIHLDDNEIDGMFNATEDAEQGTSFPLVESISIPGPPGSYLPGFRDSCFEFLQGSSSSLANGWAQSSQDADLGAAATEKPTNLLVPENMETNVEEAEKLTSDVASLKGVAWNEELNVQDSERLRRRMGTTKGEFLVNSSVKEIGEHLPNVSVKSACLSPSVLRLLGKDVMVFSSDKNATAKCNDI